MKYDENKTFPFPVLTDYSDDYVDVAFQASLDVALDEFGSIELDVEFQLSEPKLKQLIKDGNAAFAMLVKCPITYFRKVFSTVDSSLKVEMPQGKLHGKVEISFFIVSTVEIKNFASENFNIEYGGRTFDLPAGVTLAVYAPEEYYIDQEILQDFGSVITIQEYPSQPDGLFDLNLEGDMLTIIVSPTDKRRIDIARADPDLQSVVVMGVVMPVIIETLNLLTTDEEILNHEDKKWYRALAYRVQEAGATVGEQMNVLHVAQKIFNGPITLIQLPEERE